MRTNTRATISLAISLGLAVTLGVTPMAAAEPDADAIEGSLAALDGIVEEAMTHTQVPGVAVAVVAGDETVFAKGYGVRDTETQEPVDAATVFQIASLSKPVTSTIVAGVAGDRIIDWDDPVSEANPDFALSDEWVSERVTYADLLSMRSGLPGQAGNGLEGIGYDRAEILDRLRLIELNPFRDTYSYSNFGYTAGGESAAVAAGTTWEDLADEQLFGPAGMASTSARHSDFLKQQNRARLHVDVDGSWQPAFERMPDAQAPAGGNSSNVVDLARWLRLVLAGGTLDGENIIDGAALAATTTPAITKRPPMEPGGPTGSYGLGWNIDTDASGHVRWNHSGAFSVGAATTAVLVPGLDVGIVVLTNAQPVGVAEAIADAFLETFETGSITQDWMSIWSDRMAGVYGEPPEPPAAPSETTAARELAAYAGTYSNDFVGDIEVVVDDEGLRMVMGPARRTFDLEWVDGDSFVYLHDPELPQFLDSVRFVVGPGGAAESVDVSAFAGVGYGSFERA